MSVSFGAGTKSELENYDAIEIEKLSTNFNELEKFSEKNCERARILKTTQHPKIMFIACSDSRVEPAVLFHTLPGDLFVLRNVANIVPDVYNPDLSVKSAHDYAVNHLHVQHIVVMGHQHCGGIAALCSLHSDRAALPVIDSWINISDKAATIALSHHENDATEVKAMNTTECCEHTNVVLALENLMTFPYIKKGVDEKTLQLHGWYYNMDESKLFEYKQCVWVELSHDKIPSKFPFV